MFEPRGTPAVGDLKEEVEGAAREARGWAEP